MGSGGCSSIGDRSQKRGARSQDGGRRQEAGDRRQETGDRRHETGDRRQETNGAGARERQRSEDTHLLAVSTVTVDRTFGTKQQHAVPAGSCATKEMPCQ